MEKDKLLRKLMRVRNQLEGALDDALFEIEEIEKALRGEPAFPPLAASTPEGADK